MPHKILYYLELTLSQGAKKKKSFHRLEIFGFAHQKPRVVGPGCVVFYRLF